VSEVAYYRWRQEYGGLPIEQVKRLKEIELENIRQAVSDLTLGNLIPRGSARGSFGAPRVGARALNSASQAEASDHRACAALGQHRSTQRKVPRGREDEARLTADVIELAWKMAATAIARSQACCARRAGRSTTSGRADLAARG
jgi:hypothetical protein